MVSRSALILVMITINYYFAHHLSIIIWQSEKLEHVAARYLHLSRQINPFEHLIEPNVMSVNARWSIAPKLRYVKYLPFSYHFAVLNVYLCTFEFLEMNLCYFGGNACRAVQFSLPGYNTVESAPNSCHITNLLSPFILLCTEVSAALFSGTIDI